MLDDSVMDGYLRDAAVFRQKEFNLTSCYYLDGKRIFYHEIFKNPPEDLVMAILRTVPKIDMDEVYGIVDATPYISDARKEYLKKAMDTRYEQILAPALERILKEHDRGVDYQLNEDEEELEH
jgi:hypothetical protein